MPLELKGGMEIDCACHTLSPFDSIVVVQAALPLQLRAEDHGNKALAAPIDRLRDTEYIVCGKVKS